MVNIGDTVLVTLPTFLTGIGTYSGARSALQSRLQQAGFNVLRIDDSALSYWGAIAARGQLLITVIPTTSAYATVHDVASLVAGAAFAAGYDINAGVNGQVLATGVGSQAYQDLQNRPPVGDENDLTKALTGLGTPLLLVGAAALVLIVLLKK